MAEPKDYPDFPALRDVARADERDLPAAWQLEELHDLGYDGPILDRFHAWELIDRLRPARRRAS